MSASETSQSAAVSRSGLALFMAWMTAPFRCLPAVTGKPFIAGYWLLTSYIAYIAVLVMLLAVPYWLVPAADRRLNKEFAAQKVKGFFVDRITQNPKLKPAKARARVVIYSVSGALVAVLLLWRLPGAVRAAEEKSREHERKAEGLLAAGPSSSLLMYRKALRLTIDPVRSAALLSKLDGMERSGAAYNQAAATVTIVPKRDADATMLAPPPGESSRIITQSAGFSRYSLTKTLGKGAMGVVHLAHDNVLERDVAVKELHAAVAHDHDLVKRFRQEAKVLARMAHPGVVQVYDFVEGEGAAWIVMEFVRGRELADHLKEKGRMPEQDARELGRKLAEALAYAHSMGIVHRDFKPANVLLSEAGAPKIMDFGLAKLLQSAHHTVDGTVLGSPSYMSPEQAQGRAADARSDIYALGVVLYRMLTGKVPFEGNLASVLGQHISVAPRPPRELTPEVSEALNALLLSMLAKDPSERPQEMNEVARLMEQA